MLESVSDSDEAHHPNKRSDEDIGIISQSAPRKRGPQDSETDQEIDTNQLLTNCKKESIRKTSTASGTDSEAFGTCTSSDVLVDWPVKLKKPHSKRRHIVKNEILKRHAIIKYELIHNLTKYSPDPEQFALFSNVREISQFSMSAISQYLVNVAEKSERNIVAQQTDPAFANLQSWSDYLSHIHGRPSANNVAFVVKMIAEAEQHPSPEEVGGVDYKAIYSTMAALMKGYPINELDPVSKQVLVDLYDELMADVRSEVGAKDLVKMHEVFLAQVSSPLSNNGLEHTLLDSEVNPLQMSLELIEKRDDILVGCTDNISCSQ